MHVYMTVDVIGSIGRGYESPCGFGMKRLFDKAYEVSLASNPLLAFIAITQ